MARAGKLLVAGPFDDQSDPRLRGMCLYRTPVDEARRLATSAQQQWVGLRRGSPGPLPPPVDSMDGRWSPFEQAGVEHAMAYAAIGAPDWADVVGVTSLPGMLGLAAVIFVLMFAVVWVVQGLFALGRHRRR